MSISISIVIPSYNQGQFIEETILSLLDQNYPSLEVIVIDGKSTDNTKQVLEKFSDQLTYWVSEKDKGQSNAINKGFKIAKGEIISWLGSDDLLKPGSLNKIDEVFSQYPDTDLVYGKSEIFRNNKVIRIDAGLKEQVAERRLAGMTFPQPSSFFKREMLDKTGLLNEVLHYGMDYDLFAKMSLIAKTRFSDFVFSGYRIHDESKSGTSTDKFISDWLVVFNSIVKGLSLRFISGELEKLDLVTKEIEASADFFRKHSPQSPVNERKLLFYFLVNVLIFDYESEKFNRASRIAKYLSKNYKAELEKEKEILKIANRLNILPAFIISLLRKIFR